MAEGWILLHRKITKNPFWHERPFDKARAWVDMLLLANYSDSSFFVRGQEVSILRGQLAWSEVSLAERWGWSRNKVRRYLDGLKTKQQIEQQGSNLTSLITITKYEEYQVTGAAEDTTNDTPDGTANDTANDTAGGTHKKEGKKKEKKELSTFEIYRLNFFEDLWAVYPKKIGKPAALKSYNKTVKTEAEMDRINAALGAYLTYVSKLEEKYIKHGSTWFNNWQDWEPQDGN